MTDFQSIASIPSSDNDLFLLFSREVDAYSARREPGTPVHGSLVEYLDRIAALLPALAASGNDKQCAYVLRRSLRALRHAEYVQCDNECADVFDGLHASAEGCLFTVISHDGTVSQAVTRKPVSSLGAYCRAIQAKTGAALVMPWCLTKGDDLSKTVSRSWS